MVNSIASVPFVFCWCYIASLRLCVVLLGSTYCILIIIKSTYLPEAV